MNQQLIYSFPPLIAQGARVLILGSMPGIASLSAGQYYAHPRNLFWSLLGELIGFDPQGAYAERVAALHAAGIALWDVLAACRRSGSLDAQIATEGQVANDIVSLLAHYPHIRHIFFNGSAAERAFRRHVITRLPKLVPRLQRLPSSSPAHASLSRAAKYAAWATIKAALKC